MCMFEYLMYIFEVQMCIFGYLKTPDIILSLVSSRKLDWTHTFDTHCMFKEIIPSLKVKSSIYPSSFARSSRRIIFIELTVNAATICPQFLVKLSVYYMKCRG